MSLLFLLLTVIAISNSQFYSKRTKCSNNQLSLDSELSLFYQNTQYYGVTLTEIIDVLGLVKKLYHFGKKVDQPKTQNHRCSNYFMETDICCRYSDLDFFTTKLIDLYTRTYYKARHPMVDYMYKIYDQYKSMNSLCLGNYDLRLPDRNGFTKQNATTIISNIFTAIENQIRQIKEHQLSFISNSSCLWCIGIDNFKTFIHPINQDVKKTKRLIYNGQYFSNVTSMVANKMLNSKLYADQISLFIQSQLKPRLLITAECTSLINLINDTTQISRRKVCQSFEQCLRFAEMFIGAPGAPAYSKMFASIQQKRGITKTAYKLITSSQWGFKGNQTYQRYSGIIVPPVDIKGNNFTY